MAVNNFKIKVLSRAKLEVNEAAEYYDSKSKGLGKVFYLEFKNYSKTLRNIPFFEEKYNIVRILT
ncbi:hypothetical protein [Flavobacterium soyangense]|uniref:Uncharacterized protein n=1 Tax=Flavobacterium soyangense TaxID=2023265 RepID=A0A930U5J7_9FLAO|nr:hypothetical protein [Flavobacterium soyangense]MBF2707263.1 hypothetical protein [Flavobacterium soyangense]